MARAPLDNMRAHTSARAVAMIAGDIWNHLPEMLHHFEEEGIPVCRRSPGPTWPT
jgi:D-alanyl-D-alanine carboxypeptidase